MSAPPAVVTKLTTPALERLLTDKYPRDRYALFFDVPDAVSLDQRRRIDAIAVGMWKSVGRNIDGFELKVSRSDWLRELKQVDKADPFLKLCDHFWLVTADATVAKLEEIPACWGWMSGTPTGLRIQKLATRLPGTGDHIPREFFLGVLRKLQDDLVSSPDVQAYIASKIDQSQARIDQEIDWRTQRLKREIDELKASQKKFEDASGIEIHQWDIGDIGKIVKSLREMGYGGDGLSTVPKLLELHENTLRTTLEAVQKAREALAPPGSSLE